MKKTTRLATTLGLALLSGSAMATGIPSIPEPSALSLLGVAGAVVAIVAIRRRRK